MRRNELSGRLRGVLVGGTALVLFALETWQALRPERREKTGAGFGPASIENRAH